MFSVEVVVVQAQPAATSQKTISGTLRVRARVSRVPVKMAPAPASIHSAGNFRRKRGSRTRSNDGAEAQSTR